MKRHLTKCVSSVLGASMFLARAAAADEPEPQIVYAPPATPPAPVTQPAPTVSAPPPMESTSPAPSKPFRTDLWKVGAGLRTSYVTSGGFDPYSSNDALVQWSLEAQYPLVSRGKFALGVGFGYSGGASHDTIRGDKTGLGVHQLSVPIEGRYHLGSWAYVFGRVAPGTTAAVASIQEASSPNEFSSTKWLFSADLSAGTAILLGPRWNGDDKRTPRFWAVPEFGYSFATKATFDNRPDRDSKDALGTDERTALTPLNLSAFFWRISVAATF